jgi:hypothetical protein
MLQADGTAEYSVVPRFTGITVGHLGPPRHVSLWAPGALADAALVVCTTVLSPAISSGEIDENFTAHRTAEQTRVPQKNENFTAHRTAKRKLGFPKKLP